MNEYQAAVRRRDELRGALAQMTAQHEQRRASLRASEARTADRDHETQVEQLRADIAFAEAQAATIGMLAADDVVNTRSAENRDLGYSAPGSRFAPGQPLLPEQRMAQYVEARGLVREEQRNLSFGRYVRGLVTGNWQDADGERRAMVEGTATAGGHLVPTPMSAQIIDRARNVSRVLQAGAVIVPMESQTLKIARVAGDPVAAWRSELATISPSDMTFDAVTFTARTLASRVLISRELMEDAQGVDEEVTRAFSEQFGLTVDLAALYGTGTAPEPRGVKNVAAVTKTPLGANGATPTNYDPLIDSVYRVRAANHEPTAQIHSARTGQTFAKLKDTTNQYLSPPPALDGIRRLDTQQVPNNLTVGTGTATSDLFTGDWRELLIGVRHQLEITVLRERSMDVGAYELLAWWRGDVQVARPAAFDVITGINA